MTQASVEKMQAARKIQRCFRSWRARLLEARENGDDVVAFGESTHATAYPELLEYSSGNLKGTPAGSRKHSKESASDRGCLTLGVSRSTESTGSRHSATDEGEYQIRAGSKILDLADRLTGEIRVGSKKLDLVDRLTGGWSDQCKGNTEDQRTRRPSFRAVGRPITWRAFFNPDNPFKQMHGEWEADAEEMAAMKRAEALTRRWCSKLS